jgi:hypothetical protein
MVHRILADLVVAGGLLALRWRWAPLVHLPAALWGVLIELSGGICPLTPLENALRRRAGASGYAEGFVEYYLLPLIYPGELTPGVQRALATLVVVTNVLAYALVLSIRRRT